MIYGAMNNPSSDIIEELELFGRMGMNFAEIAIEGPSASPDVIIRRKKDLMKTAERYNLQLLAHGAWFLQIGHPYEKLRRSFVSECFRILDACRALGITQATFHPFSYPYKSYMLSGGEILMENTIASAKEIIERASQFGIKVCFENLTTGLFSNPEDFKILFEKVPKAGLTFDIGHANLNGNIFSFISSFRKKIVHVHAHDNDGNSDVHMPIGSGNINWPIVLKALKEIDYDRTMTLEMHTPEREFIKSGTERLIKLSDNI